MRPLPIVRSVDLRLRVHVPSRRPGAQSTQGPGARRLPRQRDDQPGRLEINVAGSGAAVFPGRPPIGGRGQGEASPSATPLAVALTLILTLTFTLTSALICSPTHSLRLGIGAPQPAEHVPRRPRDIGRGRAQNGRRLRGGQRAERGAYGAGPGHAPVGQYSLPACITAWAAAIEPEARAT